MHKFGILFKPPTWFMALLLATCVAGCGSGGGSGETGSGADPGPPPTAAGAGTGVGGQGKGPAPVILGTAGNFVILRTWTRTLVIDVVYHPGHFRAGQAD